MNRSIAMFGLIGIVSLAMLLSIRWASASDNWTAGTGNWSTPGNWSAGVPGGGIDVNITDSDGVGRTVTYNYTGAAISLGGLVIDLTGGSGSATNTFSMSANNLTVAINNTHEAVIIGSSGSGTFTQIGGTNTINNPSGIASNFFILGDRSGANGVYNLIGGTLSVATPSNEIVGNDGTGNFNQSGGTHNSTILVVGNGSGGSGSYSLSGVGILSADNEFVGENGTGIFTQIGGTNTVANGYLTLGNISGSTGTYTLSGTSSLHVTGNSGFELIGSEEIGVGGTGNFNQSGGANTVDRFLSVASGAGSNGTYTLSGGTLSAPNIYVGGDTFSGPEGQGILNVSGTGSVTVMGTLQVFNSTGSALNLSGGTINTDSLDLSGNNSHFNWTGGTLNLTNGSLIIDDSASAWNGYSSLTLNSGMALGVSGSEAVGGSGTGAVTLAGGRNFVSSSGLYVGFNSGSHGTYTISGNGSLAVTGGEVIGGSGTGVLNQSGGVNGLLSGNISLGVNSGSSGTYALSGGISGAQNIYVGGSSAGPGGTGVLTVSGSGSLTYTNQTITVYNTTGSGFNVNGGTVSATALNLMGTYTHTAGNATYGHISGGGQMNVSGGQVVLTDDTSGQLASVNVSGPATLGFDIGTSSNSQITADTATFTATPSIALTLSGLPDAGTVFTLLSATQFNDNGNLSGLSSQAVTIGRDTLTPSLTGGSGASGAIIVTVSGGSANLTWIGSNNIGADTGGAWDIQTTQNWNNHSNELLTPDVFYAGDHVTFDDTAANFVVDLNSGDVIANSVTFNNSQHAYTVNGTSGIAGQGSVTFAGSKMVTLNNYNYYSGTTTISGGGTVSISGSIASPTINVTHGILQLAASGALSGTPVITLGNGATTGVLDLYGTTNAVGGLSGGTGNLVTNSNSAPATLNFSGGCSTFGGVIQDGDSSSGGGPVALNIASGSLTLGGVNTYSGGTTVNGGTLAVNGSVAGPVSVNFGGTLAGHGTVGGLTTVAFGGILSSGNGPTSTGMLTLGSLTLNSGSQTNIKLAGITAGTQYDQIQITGPLSLDGILQVSLINGFQPAAGNAFDILAWPSNARTGMFATLQLPALSGAEAWDTSQLYTTGTLSVVPTYLAGDINRDGVVDVADISALMTALTDLSKYRSDKNLTDPTLFKDVADVNQDGFVDNADIQALITLVANNIIASGGAVPRSDLVGKASAAVTAPVTAVPEPASIVLLSIGALGIALRRYTVFK